MRELIELLVRPGDGCLVDGDDEARLRAETGRGSGRIGKQLLTGPSGLREVTSAAAGRATDLPVLLSVNQEGGRLNALDWPGVAQLPGNLALGAAGDEDLAEQAGLAIGGQLRAVGLTWNLAPVCDLGSWPSTSAVGTRAFGSDPVRVAALASAFVRGLQAAGVAATAKHFPGLGGIFADPHHAAPVVDQLPDGALLPFRAAVDAGAACVMVGSHTIRSLDRVPALASPRVLALLREELDFGGVAVSENLSIPAVHEPLGGIAEAAVAAIAAGIDVVMLDSEISRGRHPFDKQLAAVRQRGQVIQALVDAVDQGRIDRSRVDEAATRVLAAHRRFGVTPDTRLPGCATTNHAAHRVAEHIGAAALTVVRGAHLLPLVLPKDRVLAAVHVPDTGQRRADSARHAPDFLHTALRTAQRVVEVAPGGELPGDAGGVVVYGYDTRGTGDRRSQAAAEADRFARQGLMVAQVALGDIDDLTGSTADILLGAYSPHPASAAAVARVLSGRAQARGTVPILGASW